MCSKECALILWTDYKTTSVISTDLLVPDVAEGHETMARYTDGILYSAKVIRKSVDENYLNSLSVDTDGEIMIRGKRTHKKVAVSEKNHLKQQSNLAKEKMELKKSCSGMSLLNSKSIFQSSENSGKEISQPQIQSTYEATNAVPTSLNGNKDRSQSTRNYRAKKKRGSDFEWGGIEVQRKVFSPVQSIHETGTFCNDAVDGLTTTSKDGKLGGDQSQSTITEENGVKSNVIAQILNDESPEAATSTVCPENVHEGGIRLEKLKRKHEEMNDQNKEKRLNRTDSFEGDFDSILDQNEYDSEDDNLERVIRPNRSARIDSSDDERLSPALSTKSVSSSVDSVQFEARINRGRYPTPSPMKQSMNASSQNGLSGKRISGANKSDGNVRNYEVLNNDANESGNHENYEEDPLVEVRLCKPNKVLICEDFPNVWIRKVDLTCMLRWKNNPKEMARRLIRILVGVKNLKDMCARGNSGSRKGIPKDIVDCVEYYVNKKCPLGLAPEQFTSAINYMIGSIRHPKP